MRKHIPFLTTLKSFVIIFLLAIVCFGSITALLYHKEIEEKKTFHAFKGEDQSRILRKYALSSTAAVVPLFIFSWFFAVVAAARKRTEEKMVTLSKAIEQSANVVLITDVDANIEYVNPRFSQVTGYTEKEAIGQNPRMLKPQTRAPEMVNELWETITSGKEWHGEFQNKKKDGGFYWASATITPIKNDKGIITHYIGIQEDITKFKEVGDELRKNVDELSLFQDMAIAREFKMIALKKEINRLSKELGRPAPYDMNMDSQESKGE